MAVKPFVASIEFLESFGFFDVVLPFLFVFVLLFAILEKTKILGTEAGAPKKNLNAMVSFAVALFVVAATNIVDVIRQSLPLVILVLVVIISFLLLAGSFMGSEEFSFAGEEGKGWRKFLTGLMFLAVIGIFAGIIKNEEGVSYLNIILTYIKDNLWTGPVISSIIFLAVVVGVIYFVVGPKKESTTSGE